MEAWELRLGSYEISESFVNHTRITKQSKCRPVVGITDDGRLLQFISSAAAAKKCNMNARDIRRTCYDNMRKAPHKQSGKINTDHKCKGIRWYFEEDEQWMSKID